ncbi:hypothetical protein [Qipengyuania marisflavi]|uniref:hypothetical protein n=1 Tax=Qipengyuania marisflavi TaxID=2486356 RepID=UPI001485FA7E|nr:hypothetical protein [Qipengyuania marisflavi]
MSEHQIVSLISLVGFLILIASGFRSHNLSWKRGLYMAGLWAGIFAVVMLFIDAVN